MFGIIGYGAFGKFMAKHLSVHGQVFVTDVKPFKVQGRIKQATLDEIVKMPIIILAVPMRSLEKVLMLIKDKLAPGTLVLDVCSLKMFSCSAMNRLLPKSVDIVGTHPLFGPQSCPLTIKGRNLALCNVRGARLNEVRQFCEKKLKLKTFVVSSSEHDRQMAYSQALTHFIGRISVMMKVREVKLSTKTYDDFLDIANIIKNDDIVLFENIETMNPYAAKVRKEFLLNAEKLHKKLSHINNK